MKKNKRNLKFLTGILLGVLAITGGVFSMPSSNNNIYDKTSQIGIQENLKILEKSPDRFLQPTNLGLKENFKEMGFELFQTGDINEDEFYLISQGRFEKDSNENNNE
jgi:hypothetical protein